MAFNGLAIYGTNVFQSLAEDVSEEVGMISPSETPFLDILTPPMREGFNVLHEWLEDSLAPQSITASTAISSTTADTQIGIANGDAERLFVGQLLIHPDGQEYMRISVISGNTITVERAFGGTSANSWGTGGVFTVLADAALEGDDVDEDIGIGRVRRSNYMQIFKKDVIVSGSRQAVRNLGGIADELAYQRTKRLREAVVGLEKAVVLSILSGNTIGSSSAVRTMRGVRSFLSTNIHSIAVLSDTLIANVVESAWTQGGNDIDVLVVDTIHKRKIDSLQGSRVRVTNQEGTFRNVVDTYEGTYGTQRVVMSRWMPASSLFAISTNRIHVVPLQGRTFQFQPVSKTGDAEKGMIIGEYTVELYNEEGMARASITGT
ncbi:MAG: DUF5309 family protein [Mariprofundaceae bacterium]|nr:DUF5309 family protein [Mariprofundaceae bacterium]